MKRILLVLFILSTILPSVTHAQAGRWKRLLDSSTFDVAVNPLNHNMILAGGLARDLYRSYDGGKTWEKLIIVFESGSTQLNNIMIHPRDTNVYIVGGINFNDLRRTTDRGATWENVLQTPQEGVTLNGKAMEFKPGAPDSIYIADFKSANIYRSIDRGANWDSIGHINRKITIYDSVGHRTYDTLVSIETASFQIRPDSTDVMLVGSTSSEIFISTDGGHTWRLTAKVVRPQQELRDSEVTRIVFSERDPRTGYAVITYLFEGNTPNGGMYKTTDGGYNWSLIAFADTSMWTVATREFNGTDEIFMGGYTESYYLPKEYRIPGVGMVRRSQDGGKTWYSYDQTMNWSVPPLKVMRNFKSVYFINADTGYIAADDGTILRTENRGEYKWTSFQNSGTTNSLNFIKFVSKRTGFAAGDKGTILRTTDEGVNWKPQTSETTENLHSMYFTSPSTGYVSGDGGIILRTSSTGVTWVKLNTNTTDDIYSVFFVNDLSGFAAGSNGTILRTKNSGTDWEKLNTGTAELLKSICFVDEKVGYAVGSRGIMLKTENGGDSWTTTPMPTNVTLNSVVFPNADSGYIAGDRSRLITTYDAGKTWKFGDSSLLRDNNQIFMLDASYGYVAIDGATLERTYSGFENRDFPMISYGPLANMWSQRYFGDRDKDQKLYMATEAGLFVLEDLVSVDDRPFQATTDSRLNAYVHNEQLLDIKYKRINRFSGQPLQLNLVNILGEIVFSFDIKDTQSEEIIQEIIIPRLAAGAYACCIKEGSSLTTKMIIIE